MKALEHKTAATLAALVLGAWAWGPGLAVSGQAQKVQYSSPGSSQQGQQPAPGQSSPGQTSPGQAPSQGTEAESPASIMQQKTQEICLRSDKNQDGYLSKSEFKDTKKSEKVFKTADANKDGRLDMKECEKGLGSA